MALFVGFVASRRRISDENGWKVRCCWLMVWAMGEVELEQERGPLTSLQRLVRLACVALPGQSCGAYRVLLRTAANYSVSMLLS